MRTMLTMLEVMTPFPYTIEVGQSIKSAIVLMGAKNIRHLPVVSGTTLMGLLTDRDIKLALAVGKGIHDAESLRVEEIAIPEPYVVDHSERLDQVLRHMLELHIGSSLIVRGGKLVGIFTMVDACRKLHELLRAQYPDA